VAGLAFAVGVEVGSGVAVGGEVAVPGGGCVLGGGAAVATGNRVSGNGVGRLACVGSIGETDGDAAPRVLPGWPGVVNARADPPETAAGVRARRARGQSQQPALPGKGCGG